MRDEGSKERVTMRRWKKDRQISEYRARGKGASGRSTFCTLNGQINRGKNFLNGIQPHRRGGGIGRVGGFYRVIYARNRTTHCVTYIDFNKELDHQRLFGLCTVYSYRHGHSVSFSLRRSAKVDHTGIALPHRSHI
jgi:hypothetical protein